MADGDGHRQELIASPRYVSPMKATEDTTVTKEYSCFVLFLLVDPYC
jgi:hypothetical protein